MCDKTKIDEIKAIGRKQAYIPDVTRLARILKLINGRTDSQNQTNTGSFLIIETSNGFIQFLDNVRCGDIHSYIIEASPVETLTPKLQESLLATLVACGFKPLGKYGIWRREFDALASKNFQGIAELAIGLLVSYYSHAESKLLKINFLVQNFFSRLIPIEDLSHLQDLKYELYRGFFLYLVEEYRDIVTAPTEVSRLDRDRLKELVKRMESFVAVTPDVIEKLKSQIDSEFALLNEIDSFQTLVNEHLKEVRSKFKDVLFN